MNIPLLSLCAIDIPSIARGNRGGIFLAGEDQVLMAVCKSLCSLVLMADGSQHRSEASHLQELQYGSEITRAMMAVIKYSYDIHPAA